MSLALCQWPAQAQAAKEDDANKLETVVVTGISASREASLNQKRRADAIVEVITAEDIGKLPDKNVADAVQRIPGVNISSGAGGEGGFSENDRVSIRGTSASLTQTLINGHAVGTGDWFVLNQTEAVGRSVSYALLPSEIVGRVTVHKSAQADLVEGGVSGAVNVETRSPLSFKNALTAEASVQTIYSSLARKSDPQLNALFNWKSEGNSLGVLVQAFLETRHERRDGQEFLGYGSIDPHGPVAAARPELADVLYPQQINASLFTQKRVRKGGLFDVEIKPSPQLSLDLNGFYSRLSAVNFDHSYLANVDGLIKAGDIPSHAVVRGNILVEADFPNAVGTAPGLVDSIARPGAASGTWYLDLRGRWKPAEAWTVTAQAGTTRGVGDTPGDMGYESNLPATGGLNYRMHGVQAPTSVAFPGVDTANYHAADLAGAWWAVVKVKDAERYAQADAQWAVNTGALDSLKFGLRTATHERLVDYPSNGGCGFDSAVLPACAGTADWNGALYPANFGRGFGATAGTLPSLWLQDPQAVETFIRAHGQTTEPYWPGTFQVNERTLAGYAMANFSGESWSANLGGRVARTRQRVHYNVPGTQFESPNFGPYDPVSNQRSYSDFLPSANLRVDLGRAWVARLSMARTMARPDYSSMVGAIFSQDNLTNTGTAGNVDLKPVRATNTDTTLEWYFAPKSLLSLGLFNMKFSSYVGFDTTTQMLANGYHGGAIEPFVITRPVNVRARNQGFEVGYQQALGGGFGVAANYTYAHGRDNENQPLVGSSRDTYNLEAYYENERFSTRVAYTYRSSYLVGLDRADTQNEAGSGNLALSLNYKFSPQVALQFDALNLNNPTLKYYGDTPEQARAFYSNGRQFFLGLRLSL